MKYLILLCISSLVWAAPQQQVSDWRETPGLTEAQAIALTNAAIKRFTSVEDEGYSCSADEYWGYQYAEASPAVKRPTFVILANARGPGDYCSGSVDYECRIVLAQNEQGVWAERITECDSLEPIR